MAKLMRKSTNATITAAIGTINRGKYTLLIRLAFVRRLFDASPTAAAKKLQGSMPAKTISAYGAVPSEDYHGQRWPDERPRRPDHRLLVAHSDVAPSQDSKKFPVTPQVMPIVPFGSSRFDDQHVITTKGNPAEILLLLAH